MINLYNVKDLAKVNTPFPARCHVFLSKTGTDSELAFCYRSIKGRSKDFLVRLRLIGG